MYNFDVVEGKLVLVAKGSKGDTGAKGEAGADGTSFIWESDYVAETAYSVNDVVSYGGSTYICILASTGNLPTNATYWSLMAQKGADGADGEGTGDVVGPTGATADHIAVFDSTTGKLIKDGGKTIAELGGGGITWTEITDSATASVDNGYIANKGTLLTLTLPTTAAVGSVVAISGKGAGGWKIAQNADEQIIFGNKSTTVGVTGYLASVNQYDAIELVCVIANTTWLVTRSVGNIEIV